MFHIRLVHEQPKRVRQRRAAHVFKISELQQFIRTNQVRKEVSLVYFREADHFLEAPPCLLHEERVDDPGAIKPKFFCLHTFFLLDQLFGFKSCLFIAHSRDDVACASDCMAPSFMGNVHDKFHVCCKEWSISRDVVAGRKRGRRVILK